MKNKRKKPSGGQVREPIQVYLDRRERSRLDRLARELRLSRAEVLRQGLQSLERQQAGSLFEAFAPLLGAFDNPEAPSDLAERHDEYLAQDLEARSARSPRRSS